MGDFEVALFDEAVPASVSNFLAYVDSGAYANNLVHRVAPGFVVQAGGVTLNPTTPISFQYVQTNGTVKNEPKYSNLRGTLAYAKPAGNPNGASSQWFFNLKNNSASLDYSEQGFTVFGQVINNGMTIVDAIGAVKPEGLDHLEQFKKFPFSSVPLIDVNPNTELTEDNFVIIYNIVVIDADPKSSANLTPAVIEQQSESKSSGGVLNTVFLLLLALGLLTKSTAIAFTAKKSAK